MATLPSIRTLLFDSLGTGSATEMDALLRATCERLPDALLLVRPCSDMEGSVTDFECIYASPATASVLGVASAHLVGERLSSGVLHGTGTDLIQCCLAATEGTDPVDCEFHLRSGHESWLRATAVPLGREVAIRFVDITPRKEVEAALQGLRREAETGTIAKREFLGRISHEFRTPLNAILGYAQLLTGGTDGQTAEHVARSAEKIRSAAEHLRQLIEEILAFSDLQARHGRPEMEAVKIAPLLEEVGEVVESLAAEKGLRFRVEVDANAPEEVTSNRSTLRQILLSLLSNAVKFTPAGEVTLRVRCDGATAVYEVEDTGIGVHRAQQEHLFEPFWQAESCNTRTAAGTGLGLSLARRLAQRLGGSIGLESEPGRGSTFSVYLPLAPPGEAPEWSEALPDRRDGEDRRRPRAGDGDMDPG